MKPFGEFDRDYSDRMMKACFAAIIEAAHDPASNVAMLRNGEIYEALLTIMAGMLATSKETDTPRGTRLLCEDMARKLSRRIAICQDEMAVAGSPFDVVQAGDRY